jgi:cytochrome c-type biogenesis protein CcmH/NrfG
MEPAYFYSRFASNPPAKGIARVELALEDDPMAADLWVNLGYMRRAAGDAFGTETAFAAARKIAPRGVDAFLAAHQ